jgi:hypothetical protein
MELKQLGLNITAVLTSTSHNSFTTTVRNGRKLFMSVNLLRDLIGVDFGALCRRNGAGAVDVARLQQVRRHRQVHLESIIRNIFFFVTDEGEK